MRPLGFASISPWFTINHFYLDSWGYQLRGQLRANRKYERFE
jgi:hypothetical protein